jgi:hypothetical protein
MIKTHFAVYSENHTKHKEIVGTQMVRSLATIGGVGTRPKDLVTLISLKIKGGHRHTDSKVNL